MPLTRREFSMLPVAAQALAQPRRPNIVLIYCDDLGWGDLGCYGNRIIQTPNLDRLAARGTRFTDFHSTSPVCSPARAAVLTGHYPQRYGIHHADLPESLPRYGLPETCVTVAEALQRAGYATAHIGKWHVGEPPNFPAPRRHGFEFFAGCFGGRPSSPWGRYARSMDPEVIVNEQRPVVFKGHVTEVQTQAALDALNRSTRGRPFFLNVCYNAPHEPLAPIEHQAKLYRDWSPEEQTYFQTVTDMDAGVGRILAKLEDMGVAQDTLVLFSSDNGPEAHRFKYSRGSAGPLKGMKTQLWEGGVRVPGILAWPGRVPAGRVSNALASILDIFPTFTEVPAEVKLDGGVDLVALANGRVPDRALFFEFHAPQRGVEASLPMAARRGKWKLFATHSLDRVELYDLEADLGERDNVAARNPKVVADLKAELAGWWSQFAAQVELPEKRTPVPIPPESELEKRYYKN
ncbi:MAG: sulfatase-like hydrolase/transferase [Bryobacteraceae bacterium]